MSCYHFPEGKSDLGPRRCPWCIKCHYKNRESIGLLPHAPYPVAGTFRGVGRAGKRLRRDCPVWLPALSLWCRRTIVPQSVGPIGNHRGVSVWLSQERSRNVFRWPKCRATLLFTQKKPVQDSKRNIIGKCFSMKEYS